MDSYNQIKRAQELGAAAVLVYSDLRDDGTVTVENGYLPCVRRPISNIYL
jgi:N-acetylated-alpha-linked acidic dipeptidase